MNGYANQYLTNAVQSASQEQLMLMLYDGAIRFLNQAVQAIEQDTLDKRSYYINKASAIISEFAGSLDYNQDSELADNLNALYMYMLKLLMQANLHNEAEPLVEVKKLLSELRETWDIAIKQVQQENQQLAEPQENQQHHPLSVAL